jgi:hypothetical protein
MSPNEQVGNKEIKSIRINYIKQQRKLEYSKLNWKKISFWDKNTIIIINIVKLFVFYVRIFLRPVTRQSMNT